MGEEKGEELWASLESSQFAGQSTPRFPCCAKDHPNKDRSQSTRMARTASSGERQCVCVNV